MTNDYILIKKSSPLNGTVEILGAKNAVLVIMTSLILTDGVSVLENVPNNADVQLMIKLLQDLGALVEFDVREKSMRVDTSGINAYEVKPEIMNKMRASILVMGPLLARFGKAKVAFPGGDLIGLRPINYHLEGFKQLGVSVQLSDLFVEVQLSTSQPPYTRIALEYPSVGATENLLMFASLGNNETVIINAALEPEVLDLIAILQKMGAHIQILPGAIIIIKGVGRLKPVHHTIVPDRLEAGALLLATAITGGSLTIPNARPDHLDVFLDKLKKMGHHITTGFDCAERIPQGITLRATQHPQAISIKTGPYPGFPTDLQPSMMAALCLAEGTSTIEETVYENRMLHTKELAKMGAQITVNGTIATIRGVEALYGCDVIASDIRASCALVLAGFVAFGQTKMTGVHHWKRGYDQLEVKLSALGGNIQLIHEELNVSENQKIAQTLPS